MNHNIYAAMCSELGEIKLAALTPQQRAKLEQEAKVETYKALSPKLAALPSGVLKMMQSTARKASMGGLRGAKPLTMSAGRVVEQAGRAAKSPLKSIASRPAPKTLAQKLNPMAALRASASKTPRTLAQRRAISSVGGGGAALV
jgi:hypothetical protein